MSIFGCRNYTDDDNNTCSKIHTCNHCQKMEALEELTDTQHRLIKLLKEKLA
jgi:hypothetical protein